MMEEGVKLVSISIETGDWKHKLPERDILWQPAMGRNQRESEVKR